MTKSEMILTEEFHSLLREFCITEAYGACDVPYWLKISGPVFKDRETNEQIESRIEFWISERSKMSDPGKNFNGEDLNENTLQSGVLVRYDGMNYVTGNRRDNVVELFDMKGVLRTTVDCRHISLLCAKETEDASEQNGISATGGYKDYYYAQHGLLWIVYRDIDTGLDYVSEEDSRWDSAFKAQTHCKMLNQQIREKRKEQNKSDAPIGV